MSGAPLSMAGRIDRRCDEFERSWKSCAPPQIEAYLSGWEGPERAALVRELVAVDAECRLAARGKVNVPDYAARFPDLSGDVPRTLGQYVLLERIGSGAMGTVYRALHRKMKREVAVKVLRAGAGDRARLRRLFDREVLAAAQLCHPNIVAAYDAGEDDGLPYLVSQFIEGDNLATVVRRSGPLPVEVALDCVLQAARGLAYFHQQGFIHRDVKPANLIVDDEGVVRVLDVGLARLRASTCGDHDDSTLTQIVGTPAYMAPEQAAGTRCDCGADVYALGCTLYFLLTGRTVFPAGEVTGQLAAHRHSTVPCLSGDLAPLNPLLFKMLAKRPEDRHDSMESVIRDVERLRAPHPRLLRILLLCAVFFALCGIASYPAVLRREPAAILDAPFDGRVHQDNWARHLDVPVEANHPTGITFRLIPPGRCWIGSTQAGIEWMLARESNPSARRRISSEARRMATLAAPMYMAKTEVTVAQFRRFVDATGYVTQVERERRPAYGLRKGVWVQDAVYSWRNLGSHPLIDDRPVCNLTYQDAVAFCDWLTATSKPSSRFRLPTEAEWEYACRAGGGGAWPSGQSASLLETHAWCRTNAGDTDNLVRAVATRSPNAFGLHDMLGNVEELCVAGSAPSEETPDLVLKGGNIAGGPLHVRPAARNPTHPAAPEGGFRVVMESLNVAT